MKAIRNRGKHPNDDKLFSTKWHSIFKAAVDDLCYLLSRGYAASSALQVVGNRYKFNKRQRNALLRISCSEAEKAGRNGTACAATELENSIVEIDGFNLLILLESALSGAYLFKGRDGLYRDISSVHGSYKRVLKTEEAIRLTGKVLANYKVKLVKWYLDRPVSNSGKLKQRLLELSVMDELNWEVELVFNPDKVLAKSNNIVVSSDGWILDHAQKWFNLGAILIEQHIDDASVLEV